MLLKIIKLLTIIKNYNMCANSFEKLTKSSF